MSIALRHVVKTVLVGHSDGRLRRELRDALRGHGLEVLGTPHAAEVRGAAADYGLDVFLAGGVLDQGVAGVQLIEELAEEHAVPGVLLVTEPSVPALRDLGSPSVFGCVTWPLSEVQLYATVRSAAVHRERLQRARELRALGRRLAEVHSELSRTLDGAATDDPATSVEEAFSPRERQVLRLLLAHKRPKTIAAQLGISPSTVRNHLKSMFSKVGVASQEDLLEAVLRMR